MEEKIKRNEKRRKVRIRENRIDKKWKKK